MRLQGQIALITGGNTGIGRGVALAFAREGADVAIGYVERESEATGLVTAIRDEGHKALAVHADVTSEADVKRLVSTVTGTLGDVDVLVNCAGIQKAQGLAETTVEDWDRMMSVHLRGTFLCCREVAPRMLARRQGRIINVTSQLAYLGRARYAAYSAAKAGVLALTRALARELAPDVLVNAVAPGLIDTGFDPLPEAAKEAHAASLPLQRLGTPDDLVGAFILLASDEGRYFCGQTLHPNGGEIMP
jgi:3-oxoacyl-[acyl-carrier protein] reductase